MRDFITGELNKKLISAVLCLALAFVMLAGCGGEAQSGPAAAAEAKNYEHYKLAYIPLDNRPINDLQVRQLAESLGLELLMPSEDIYATCLNGAVNGSGLQYGDRAAVLEWLIDNESEADAFVIYLDQLLSGGLMNSRCMAQMEDIVLSDGRSFSEYDVIDYIAELAGERRVYVIDSHLRLAASSTYLDFTSQDYSITRAYGLVERPEYVAGSSVEDIVAASKLDKNGGDPLASAELSDELKAYLEGSDVIERFLAIRERKLRLNAYAIQKLYGADNVSYIFGVDDSAAGNNIQTLEYSYLNELAGGELTRYPAIDCLGEMVVSGVFRDLYSGQTIRASLEYFGGDGNVNLNFAGLTVGESLAEVAEYSGIEFVSDNAEISVLVGCCGATDEETEAGKAELSKRLKENNRNKIPTIYIDFASSVNTILPEENNISLLLSAGLHANGSGASAIMGLSQGAARYRALSLENYLTEENHEAFLQELVFMFAKGYYWNSGSKYQMGSFLADNGFDAGNMNGLSEEDTQKINAELTKMINYSSSAILESVKSGKYISSVNPYTLSAVKSAEITDCSYPWKRTFEFTSDILIRLK